jgi:hypothetical protein
VSVSLCVFSRAARAVARGLAAEKETKRKMQKQTYQ